MDQERFDAWTKVLAIGTVRRRLLGGLLGLTPPALVAVGAGAEPQTQRKRGQKERRKAKRTCTTWEYCRGKKCCTPGQHCLARGKSSTCQRCPAQAGPCRVLQCGRVGSRICVCVTSLEGVKGCSFGSATGVQQVDCRTDAECTDLALGTPALCVDTPCFSPPFGFAKTCLLKNCQPLNEE